MKIERIHHVAYRCHDAKETVEWYVENLKMDFVLAIAEDQVPSTKEPDPYMHVFLDAGQPNRQWAAMKTHLNGCNTLPLRSKTWTLCLRIKRTSKPMALRC